MNRNHRLGARVRQAASLGGGVLSLAIAVPLVEFHVARRIPKKAVPGPHPLDGVVDGWRPGAPLRCVWLGDSLSSGVGARGPEESLPHQTARLVAADAHRPVALTVLAVPGARLADIAANQLPPVAALVGAGAVDVVILAAGANDVTHLTRPRDFKDSYRRILERLGAVKVVCVGIPDIGCATILAQPLRALAGVASRRADRWIRKEAARAGARYVDISRQPGSCWRRRAAELLAEDRYHPNAAGYGVWAVQVAAVLGLAGGTAAV